MEISGRQVRTNRLSMQVYESGADDGVPVVLVHGNLATGRFYEKTMEAAPAGYRMIAPDMRGFGHTEALPIDATRGCGTGRTTRPPWSTRSASTRRSTWSVGRPAAPPSPTTWRTVRRRWPPSP